MELVEEFKHLSFMFLTISSATGTGLLVEGE